MVAPVGRGRPYKLLYDTSVHVLLLLLLLVPSWEMLAQQMMPPQTGAPSGRVWVPGLAGGRGLGSMFESGLLGRGGGRGERFARGVEMVGTVEARTGAGDDDNGHIPR